jgi:hypothetical protein
MLGRNAIYFRNAQAPAIEMLPVRCQNKPLRNALQSLAYRAGEPLPFAVGLDRSGAGSVNFRMRKSAVGFNRIIGDG